MPVGGRLAGPPALGAADLGQSARLEKEWSAGAGLAAVVAPLDSAGRDTGMNTGMNLNPHQRRAVAITLRLLEERLRMIEDLLDRGEEGVLYRRPALRIDPGQRARLDALLGDTHRSIEALAESLQLAREEQDPVGRIVALLNISWENLGEIDARRLRAYGAVDPDLHAALDPALRRLTDLVFELQAQVASLGVGASPSVRARGRHGRMHASSE